MRRVRTPPQKAPAPALALALALALAVAAAIGVLAAPATTAGAGAHPARRPPSIAQAATTITVSAHVAFENCNAQHIVLSATVLKHAYPPTQSLTVTVRLTNSGSSTCGSPVTEDVPQARSALSVGPCGTLPLIVRTSRGVDAYPGPEVFNCPLEVGFRLGPHSTAQATGSWSQTVYLGSPAKPRQAPAGTYRLVVDGAVAVPVTLARARP